MARPKASEQSAASDPYEELRTRERWKREDAARVLEESTRSGDSMAAFSRRHALSLKKLRNWRDRLKGASAAQRSVRLVAAVARPAPLLTLEGTRASASVIVEAQGIRVEEVDPQSTDPQWVAALVASLREAQA